MSLKTHVINLARRPDRRLIMQQQLEQYSLDATFVAAYDGADIEPSRELNYAFIGNDFGCKRSVIGCALSHFKLWLQLAREQAADTIYLILEDDVVFNFDPDRDIIDQLVLSFRLSLLDCLYLGHSTLDKSEARLTKTNWHFEALGDQCRGGSFAYLLTVKGAKSLVRQVQERGIRHGIDYFFMKTPFLKAAALYPQAMISEWGGNSDITGNNATINVAEGWTFQPGLSNADCFMRMVPNQTMQNAAWHLYNYNTSFDMADLMRMAIDMKANAFSTDGTIYMTAPPSLSIKSSESRPLPPPPRHSFWFSTHGTFFKTKELPDSNDPVIRALGAQMN